MNKNVWDQFKSYQQQIALLSSTHDLLEWDARTKLPSQGAEYRSEQISHLAGMIHQQRTAPEVGQWLGELRESPSSDTDIQAMVREMDRRFQKESKIPERLVTELSRATSLGQTAWVEARAANDFAAFQPHLETIVTLKREYAEAIGYEEHIYDVLLDDYEPYQTTKSVAAALEGLREELVPLVAAIVDSGHKPNRDIVRRHYPEDAQRALGATAATAIGFDFEQGRLDETHHPFCITLGPKDVRLTTRYDENFLPSSLFGTMHEAGHGIYEQGLPSEWYGLPMGSYCSLGIHESQSRLWENMVGRSRAFWDFFYRDAQQAFPEALGDVSLDDFHFAINDVQPSLIRVEADEATYNLHIIIRFELEQALLSGDLAPADAPGAWNEKYEQYLGITPPTDADGVLQDVHWSAGLMGYFATYSLGNLYGAQLFAAAQESLGDLHSMFSRGEFAPLREWLQQNVYQYGAVYPAHELVERCCGETLNHQPLMDYLRHRYRSVGYDV